MSKVKLRGIRLGYSMSWSDQINDIIGKMSKGIAVAKKMYVFKILVQSIVLSHICYWPNATQTLLRKIERLE